MRWFVALAIVLGLAVAAFFLIDIRKTEEGSMPKYQIDVGSISVQREEKTVKVPKVEVGSTEKTVTVPRIVVEGPKEPESVTPDP